MVQQSIEERLTSLESQMADLRVLQGLRTDVQELRVRLIAHEEYVNDRFNTFEAHIDARLDVAEEVNAARFQEHQTAIESLASQVRLLTVGQQQILDILIGRPPKIHD